jgi:hypothetical protein
VTENGIPLKGARLFIGKNKIIDTNTTGSYDSSAQEGQVRVMAISEAGEFIGEEMLTLTKGETRNVSFNYQPGTLEVIVLKNNIPVKGARVIAGRNAPVSTDQNGTCLQKVAAGQVKVYIRLAGNQTLIERTAQIVADQKVVIRIE